ncbi:MAG TPA: DUF2156 domain-containing protein [Gemmatimonas sp.]|nr:DUF2156 domain-containing protein [Gemmatimonas sp.]
MVLQYGRTSTAFQAMSRGMSHWFDGDGEDERGLVAYVDTDGAWVAAGEPVAAAGDAIGVAERFVEVAKAAGRRSSFFATEGILASSPRFRRTLIGEQPVWDPAGWSAHIAAHRSLREQLRRARAKGVHVRRVSDTEAADPPFRDALLAIITRWFAARPMPRMGFLVDVAPLEHLSKRLLFVAERHGRPVALLSLAPVPERQGWLFEHLLREPSAPNGTSELLVDGAMRHLAGIDVHWASLGLAPLAGEVSGFLRLARWMSRPLFNFRGLSAFKRKLRPDTWAPIYLVYPRETPGWLAMLDGLRAFAGGSLVRFAAGTALRGPRPLLRALTLLLVPWTIAIALWPTHPWFPSRLVHAAWVVFDLGLLLLLRRLHLAGDRSGDTRLATTAAALVSADALLTLGQSLAWTAPALQREGMLSTPAVFAIVAACAGPLLTAPVLWGAVVRLRRLRTAP